jgi:oxygen-dependent protoporphyrinogen oxidase
MSASVGTLVVGAGISGLAFAHELGKREDVLVLESAARAGGYLRTEQRGPDAQFRCELGPETLRADESELRSLLNELDLATHAPPVSASRRFVVHHGKLVEVALAPQKLLASPLIGAGGKLRAMREPWRDAKTALDGSIADFVRHRFGGEVLDALIDPLVSGVYAGDPGQLSMRACFPRLVELVERHGSLLRAMRREHGTAPTPFKVRGGNGALSDALASKLGDRLRCSSAVRSLAFDSELWRAATASESFSARRVVLAVPSQTAERLLSPVATSLARALGSIASESLAVVHHAYRRASIEHALDGFGYLVPSRERNAHLGTLFSSSIEPDACPRDYVLLRTMLGGARHPGAVDASDAEMLATVAREVGPLLGLREPPVWSQIDRCRGAIPRYDLQHLERVDAIERSAPPGLSLLGNYLRGIGVGQLVKQARELAAR